MMSESTDEMTWSLMGMIWNGTKNEITLAKLSNTDNWQDGQSPINLAAVEMKHEKHNPWATPRNQTLLWQPATTQSQVWSTQRGADGKYQLNQRRTKLSPTPPDPYMTIRSSFDDMTDVYKHGGCGLWSTFSSKPLVKMLLKLMTTTMMDTKNEDSLSDSDTDSDDSNVHSFTECIVGGVTPTPNPRSMILSHTWDDWRHRRLDSSVAWASQTNPTAMNCNGKPRTESTMCACFTGPNRGTANENCTITEHTRPEDEMTTLSPHDWRPPEILADNGEAHEKNENYTCTCGHRFPSVLALDTHRFTVHADGQPHQRCASEMPAAGGAFVIIDVGNMRPLAASAINCTMSGCDSSNSTQAETLTAVMGIRTLLAMDLRGKTVTTFCDNSAMDLRTAKIQSAFTSKRQVTKMNNLALSSSYADHNALLATRCAKYTHHWRGAEHNLSITADRNLADVANMISDYYAGEAAKASSRTINILPTPLEVPQLKKQPFETHVNGSVCSLPTEKIMERALHCQTLAEMCIPPDDNCDANQAQWHQHCAHARDGHIDFTVLDTAMKTSRPAQIDAFSRHVLDVCAFTDSALINRLPKDAAATAKAVLKHCNPSPKGKEQADPCCLLCKQRYGDSANLARQTRHYTYECTSFKDLRKWRENCTTSIVMQTGKAFHSNPSAAIGFYNEIENIEPLFINDSDCKRDKENRIRIGDDDHRFSHETLHANWQNACLPRCTRPKPDWIDATPFWRARLQKGKGFDIQAHLAFDGIDRLRFKSDLTAVCCNVVKNKMTIEATQPHPTILAWLVLQFNLVQQCDTTPFNCTTGIFPKQPMLSPTIPLPNEIDVNKIGFRPNVPVQSNLDKSSFISVQTSSKSWRVRLEQAKNSVRDDPDITVVCMLMLDGDDKQAACARECQSTGGTVILHCPASTMTVVEPTGFKENVDPGKRVRTSADFRQPGHKPENKRQRKVSYGSGHHGNLLGPTTGDAANIKRHFHSTCTHEIVFIVFTKADPLAIFTSATNEIRDLCQRFTDTNPPELTFWKRREIKWVCHVKVALSANILLAGSTTAKSCLAAFIDTDASFCNKDTYHSDEIKLGCTSKHRVRHIQALGTSIPDARLILSAIAKLDMVYLEMLEDAGKRKMWQLLLNAGVPIDDKGHLVHYEECASSECPLKTTLCFEQTHTNAVNTGGLCIVCATQTKTTFTIPAPRPNLSSRQRAKEVAVGPIRIDKTNSPARRATLVKSAMERPHCESDDDDVTQPLLRRTSSTSSLNDESPSKAPDPTTIDFIRDKVIPSPQQTTNTLPDLCAQVGDIWSKDAIKYQISAVNDNGKGKGLEYTMDEIGLSPTGMGTVVTVTSPSLHSHHKSKHQRTHGSWKRLKGGAPNRGQTDKSPTQPQWLSNGARSRQTTGKPFGASQRLDRTIGQMILDQSQRPTTSTVRSHSKDEHNVGQRNKGMQLGLGQKKGSAFQKRDKKRNRHNGSDTEDYKGMAEGKGKRRKPGKTLKVTGRP